MVGFFLFSPAGGKLSSMLSLLIKQLLRNPSSKEKKVPLSLCVSLACLSPESTVSLPLSQTHTQRKQRSQNRSLFLFFVVLLLLFSVFVDRCSAKRRQCKPSLTRPERERGFKSNVWDSKELEEKVIEQFATETEGMDSPKNLLNVEHHDFIPAVALL